ncbi:AAA family ATPase [Zooshikella harenae]|uniref:AAA family ATPase n=1 Tax=Zooshikella harenae TaxID=2827238 RepID=A0ABS5ZER4_9GAMM|nr:AAA family ATPase [Zooshikella harenae]MBU2712556.1 AAA family ATPase [Zooshikella harenae]
MKILELRFKNLNSLYGEWFIDFTHPEYEANGIFALTGPTGAGKSTILDAICLALYGATPRLGRITKSGNEIMSRQTGECYAEVVFESQAGRFRCHWGQHRARKKALGKLAEARHEISDADSGKTIETKKSLVLGVIEEKTGMDFDRFTRSILLAQGGFDTFLKADTEQKSKILEQITGTEIYSSISLHVHQRSRKENEALNFLQAEVTGINILDEEQEGSIKQQMAIKEQQALIIETQIKENMKAIAWLTNIDELRKEINLLNNEEEKFQLESKQFIQERERLKQGLKASELEGSYAVLNEVRKLLETEQISLNSEETKVPNLQLDVSKKETLLKQTEQKVIEIKKAQKALVPLLQKVRSVDHQLTNKKQAISHCEDGCKKVSETILREGDRLQSYKSKYHSLQNELDAVEVYLDQHQADEWLLSGYTGVETQLERLNTIQHDILEKKSEKQRLISRLSETDKGLESINKELKQVGQKQCQAEGLIQLKQQELEALLNGRLLREFFAEREMLYREIVLLQKISDLESERTRLEDGKPCPLCGAKDHPYALGNVPEKEECEKKIAALTDLLEKVNLLEEDINKQEKIKHKYQQEQVSAEKRQFILSGERQMIEKECLAINTLLSSLTQEYEEVKHSIRDKLKPLNIIELQEFNAVILLKQLKERITNWQLQKQKKEVLSQQKLQCDGEIKTINAVLETHNSSLNDKQAELSVLQIELEALHKERHDLFGSKKADEEESRVSESISDAELEEKNARDNYISGQQQLSLSESKIQDLKIQIAKKKVDLNKKESEFKALLSEKSFSNEQVFIDARLSVDERNRLQLKERELEKKRVELEHKQKDREMRLATEISKNITDLTLDELEFKQKGFEESFTQLRDNIAELKHKIAENSEAKARVKEKQNKIEAQKKECLRWEKLHALIGSADGKKYRNFAQGLTFERMVSHANRQLEKMTDRYLLIRDEKQPLALNVVDNYQAGEVRSTKNLSGGECFIVSLSLALGLSHMASKNVRVDSLFLDEGFGSLDEEALDIALETLAGLEQEDKLIGVISHVTALKERISTQIQVSPQTGGQSLIVGHGCKRI